MKSKRLPLLATAVALFLTTNLLLPKIDHSFGKTHLTQNLKRSLRVGKNRGPIAQVFFSPDDDVRGVLLDLIACECEAIYFAAFLLTDEVIVEALIEAMERGIVVQVVTDQLCCRGRHGKVGMLAKQGIDVLVYCGRCGNSKSMSDIMHNKFIVFKKNILDRAILWTGSFNFTHSAQLRNQENVLILDNAALIDRYLKQFDVLGTRCTHYHENRFKKKYEKRIYKVAKKTPKRFATKKTRKYGKT